MHPEISISIVIPARDSIDTLRTALSSIRSQSILPHEIIIVDDGSSEAITIKPPDPLVRVHRLDTSRGPAVARNTGAESVHSDVILFIDADVMLRQDVIERVRHHFSCSDGVAAVQGVYTPDTPDGSPFCSRYQNHYYNFSFQSITSDTPALCATFCFAVRRSVFMKTGGFDCSILKPTVEDEAFGYALAQSGHRILLDKDLMVTHLAHYSFYSLIRRKFRMSFNQVKSFLRGNAPPVSIEASANRTHHHADTLIAVILTPFLLLLPFLSWPAAITWIFLYTASNARFWKYLVRREPPVFAAEMILVTWVDQLTIFCGLAAGTIDYLTRRRY